MLYVYRMILGDFDVDGLSAESTPLAIFFFLACTIFNMIVMLNLLIAIISESFAAIHENAENAMYQQRASLIAENEYLVPE